MLMDWVPDVSSTRRGIFERTAVSRAASTALVNAISASMRVRHDFFSYYSACPVADNLEEIVGVIGATPQSGPMGTDQPLGISSSDLIESRIEMVRSSLSTRR